MVIAIFDVDGTLVDSVKSHAAAWQDVLREFGHPVPFNDIRQQIGKGSDELLKAFLKPDEIERFGQDYRRPSRRNLPAQLHEARPSVPRVFARYSSSIRTTDTRSHWPHPRRLKSCRAISNSSTSTT